MAEARAGARRGRLAVVLQDALTVTVRLRRGESVATDAVTFRNRIKTMLGAATQDAAGLGYAQENVRLAVYGFTVFLDESVLASRDPMFADWARRPLQEELFGEHTGGENFFRHLESLLRQPDSDELSDVLEVYLICLLLGFHGRYPAGGPALDQMVSAVSERIRRIRGEPPSAAWLLPEREAMPVLRDRVGRALATLGVVGAVGLLVLYVLMKLSLSSGIDTLREAAAGLASG